LGSPILKWISCRCFTNKSIFYVKKMKSVFCANTIKSPNIYIVYHQKMHHHIGSFEEKKTCAMIHDLTHLAWKPWNFIHASSFLRRFFYKKNWYSKFNIFSKNYVASEDMVWRISFFYFLELLVLDSICHQKMSMNFLA
jgi:hypothetical protein